MARSALSVWRAGLALLLTGITSLACSRGRAAGTDTLEWLNDYREGLRQARQTQKPILIEFRCGP